jgi:DNA-binding XRE family transcriptional regulator
MVRRYRLRMVGGPDIGLTEMTRDQRRTFGERLPQFRRAASITKKALSRRSGVALKTLDNAEAGKTVLAKDTVLILRRTLRLSV